MDFAFAQSRPFGAHEISTKHWPTTEGISFAGAATRPAWNSLMSRLLWVRLWEVLASSIPSRDDQTWYRRTVSNDSCLSVNGCIARLPSSRVHVFLDTLLYLLACTRNATKLSLPVLCCASTYPSYILATYQGMCILVADFW